MSHYPINKFPSIQIQQTWFLKIKTEGKNLTPWEQQFMRSIESLLQRNIVLSDAQIYNLEKIYANRTPD